MYGRQEEARVGYNPMKPGRPSNVYQAMLFSAAKLVVKVDVQAGNQTASQYAQPTLWGWRDAREKKDWPTLLRDDIAHGNEEMMAGAEAITPRPLFQHWVARRTRHATQTQLSLSSQHGKAREIAYLLSGISSCMQAVEASAEQLTERVHWPSIVKRIFQDCGRFPLAAPRIMASTLLQTAGFRIIVRLRRSEHGCLSLFSSLAVQGPHAIIYGGTLHGRKRRA